MCSEQSLDTALLILPAVQRFTVNFSVSLILFRIVLHPATCFLLNWGAWAAYIVVEGFEIVEIVSTEYSSSEEDISDIMSLINGFESI